MREAEATRARTLVEEEVERFDRWLASLDVVPTVAALRERGEAIVETGAARRTSRAGSRCRTPTASACAAMARAIVARLLHEPTLRLKGAAGEEHAPTCYVQALRELFGLDGAAPGARGRAPAARSRTSSRADRRR